MSRLLARVGVFCRCRLAGSSGSAHSPLVQGLSLHHRLASLQAPRVAAMAAAHTDACKASKKELRKELRAALKQLSEEQKVAQSACCCSWAACAPTGVCNALHAGKAITQRLLDSRIFEDSRSVALYLTCAKLNEVDTAEVMHSVLSHGAAPCSVRKRAGTRSC